MDLTLEQLNHWLERYFAAWRSNLPEDVAALFADDAVYHYGPFKEPVVGRDAIVRRWVSDPDQQQDLQFHYTPLAVNANLGIAHWQVAFCPGRDPSTRIELDGILMLTFDGHGRCTEHREWYAVRETTSDTPDESEKRFG